MIKYIEHGLRVMGWQSVSLVAELTAIFLSFRGEKVSRC